MIKSLSRSLVQFSLFLFLISAVGLVGLNNGLDPRNVTRVQAHAIVIELTSSGGNTLVFGLTANCVPSAMAPSDICEAGVVLQNTGEGAYRLSAPEISTSGPLSTCGGGGWFTASVGSLSYVPNADVIGVGDTESFDVFAALNLATPNDCQGLPGTIVITLVATAPDEAIATPTLTPVATSTPTTASTTEVLGARATPEPTRTATTVPSTPRPVSTFVSEVLPSRFPSTGQGGLVSESAVDVIRLVCAGIGLIALGLLTTGIALAARRRSDG